VKEVPKLVSSSCFFPFNFPFSGENCVSQLGIFHLYLSSIKFLPSFCGEASAEEKRHQIFFFLRFFF
jgi:hypothetical protein